MRWSLEQQIAREAAACGRMKPRELNMTNDEREAQIPQHRAELARSVIATWLENDDGSDREEPDELLLARGCLQALSLLKASQEDAVRLRGEIDRLRALLPKTMQARFNDGDMPEPIAPPGADAMTTATVMVSRWEHGSEEHRQWLRDMCVPEVARALDQYGEQAARAALEACALHIEGGGWRMQTVGEAIRAFGRERATVD